MAETGAQIVPAGDQGQDRGEPETDLADQADRERPIVADDQEAERDHLDGGLPFG
jgi:hypothetical protein